MFARVILLWVGTGLLVAISGCQGTKTTVSNEQKTRISQILLTPKKSETMPDGWELVLDEESGCSFAYPENEWYVSPFVSDEWEGESDLAMVEDGGIYSLDFFLKQHLTSDREFCDAYEADVRLGDKQVLSTDLDVGEGVYCRAFATADCDELLGEVHCSTRLSRIYITKDKVYILSVTLGYDELDDEAAENFFASFALFDTEKQQQAIEKFSIDAAIAMAKEVPIDEQNGIMLILFESSEATLNDAEETLKDTTAFEVKKEGDSSSREFLRVTYPNGPAFRIYLNTDEAVKQRIEQLAPHTAYEEGLTRCDAQFEVVLEDLYGAIDETNALIDLQATLEELTSGFQLNCWNGNLSAAESSEGSSD